MHAEYVMPIWDVMSESNLFVFTSPIYALRTTAKMKAMIL